MYNEAHTDSAHNLSCLWCAEYIIHQDEPIIRSHCVTLASTEDGRNVNHVCQGVWKSRGVHCGWDGKGMTMEVELALAPVANAVERG